MPDFLDDLAAHITSKYEEKINEITLVFPSRRAGLFFKNIMAKKVNRPIWMPEVLSIVDFVSIYSGIKIENNLILNFQLYDIYKSYFPDETFDRYYHWGNIILEDFDTVDKHLAEPGKVFEIIKDIKKIEERFPTELSEEYKNFWKNLSTDDTEEKREFLRIWEKLGSIYRDFSKILSAKKTGYEGFANKYFLLNLKQEKIKINKHKIIFAGLNLITPSELGIISELIKNKQCEIHFDCDKYYYNDSLQEAGRHIRRAVKSIENIIKENEFDSKDILYINEREGLLIDEKKINSVASPTQTGMVKSLGNELSNFINYVSLNERTAIVLPEESLLLQVLFSIPDEVKEYNITMGYPFNSTLLYSFLILLNEFQRSIRLRNGKTEYYFPAFKKLLLHPYIKFSDTGQIFDLIRKFTSNNTIYFDPAEDTNIKEITEKSETEISDLLNNILNCSPGTDNFYPYLNEIIKSIYNRIENSKSEDNSYKKFQFEYIFHFYNSFVLICDNIKRQKIEIDNATLWKILIDISSRIRIPFTGEPLRGLQIMGLLETRCIDFDNIFILSMNEGIFPKSAFDISFIPYAVRKYFRLPTFEDEDSVYAYYFYRLLQNAKNIFLFHDTGTDNSSKGKSRFLYQIEKELIRRNNLIKFEEINSSPGVETSSILPISIEKSENVMNLIHNIKEFSASAFISLITCRLKFYFDYILRLKEPEEIETEFGTATLGSIYHKIMYSLYHKYQGKIVTGKIINTLINNLEKKFDDIFLTALQNISEKEKKTVSLEQSPKNTIYKFVIRNLVKSTLECDFEYSPFHIISLEEKFSRGIEFQTTQGKKEIFISGYIDRIDSIDNIIRIIDYKTGSNHYKELKKGESNSFLEDIFTSPKNKDSFQTFYYAFGHYKNTDKKYIPVIYYVNGRSKIANEVKKTPITREEFGDFSMQLTGLLTEIYNPEIPFFQTENQDNCKYCPYKDLCYRNI